MPLLGPVASIWLPLQGEPSRCSNQVEASDLLSARAERLTGQNSILLRPEATSLQLAASLSDGDEAGQPLLFLGRSDRQRMRKIQHRDSLVHGLLERRECR